MLLCYQIALTAILGLIFFNAFHNLCVLKKPPTKGPLPDPPPLVSVLIPARNEGRNIARCVKSLLKQDYPRLEILVLDDGSTDQTAAIVEELAEAHPFLQLLPGRPLPPGWHGKAYACHQLSQAAKGSWLLFTDADTVHSPRSVSSVIRAALREKADLLTLLPYCITETFWEKVTLPLISFFFLSYLPIGLITRSKELLLSAALGPFMLFRRDFYFWIGGHEAVRQNIVEDMGLGRLVKKAGGRLVLMDGTDVVAVRFYHGWWEIWQGLSKSAFSAFGSSLLPFLGLLAFNCAIFIAPYGFLVGSLLRREATLTLCWLPLAQISIAWAIRLLLARRFRMSYAMAFLHPLTVLVGVLTSLNSVRWTLTGHGVVWKGRCYRFERSSFGH